MHHQEVKNLHYIQSFINASTDYCEKNLECLEDEGPVFICLTISS